MRHILCLAVLAAAVLAAGCRRESDNENLGIAEGRPEWDVAQVEVIEGGKVNVILRLSRTPTEAPVDVSLESNDPAHATVPDVVTFGIGVDTKTVTITTLTDDNDIQNNPLIKAETNTGSSTLGVLVIEDDVTVGPASGVVALGTGSAVMLGAGADGIFQTGDDELIVANDVGEGEPVLIKVVIGAVNPGSASLPVVTGISDSVLVITNGADLILGTTDDALVQVGTVSATPTVTSTLVVGRMEASAARRPVIVGSRAVIASRGPDGITSADDGLLVISGIGSATLVATAVPLPGLAFEAPSIPVRHDADSVLVTTSGPDFTFGTGNETLVLVSALSTTPVVTTLFTGRINGNHQGQPVSVGATVAAVLTAGADTLFNTADDSLEVVRDVLTVPVLAPSTVVGPVTTDTAARAVATGADAVLVPLLGADLLPGTADDQVALVSSLSVDPIVVTPLAAAGATSGATGRLVVLSSSTAARVTLGADFTLGTADDGLIILTGLTGLGATSSFLTGPLGNFPPFVTSTSSLALIGEGPDATLNTSDDVTLGVTGVGGAPALGSASTGFGGVLGNPALIFIPGGNVIGGITAGADASPSTADDRFSVFSVP